MYVNKYIKILLFKIFLINNSTINKYIIINIYRAALFGPRVPNMHLVPSVQSPPRRTSPRAVHMEPVPTPPPYPEPKSSSVRAPSGHDSLRQFVDSACPVSPVTHELFFSCEPGFPHVLSPRLFCTHA